MKRKVFSTLYQPYKWLIFFPFLSINTFMFGIIAVLTATLVNEKVGSYYGGVLWARVNAFFTPMFVKVNGKKNIIPGKSYVIISNHQSYYDIFLIYGWLGIDIKWIMKKELGKIPGIGFGSRKVGHIFLDRSNSRLALESLNQAKQKLSNGSSVVIFPEGTRSKSGKLGIFKRGAFKLALDLDLPILPITIKGTKDILPTGTSNLLPGKVEMIIHEPIDITGYNDLNIKELIDKTWSVINEDLNVDNVKVRKRIKFRIKRRVTRKNRFKNKVKDVHYG